jgi:hypothetical protein
MTYLPESGTLTQPEKRKEVLEDNARKFTAEMLEPALLEELGASGYILMTDWLETGEENEKKIVHKRFDNGDTQILLISKATKDGHRIAEKEKITEEQYRELLPLSILHLEKKRYEFGYTQNDINFFMKYDEFANTQLRILEVDASDENSRNAFSPKDFSDELSEVTGNRQYYGYRVADIALPA